MEDETIDISKYIDALVRRWWLLAAGPVVGLLVALGLSLSVAGAMTETTGATRYEATTFVLMEGTAGLSNSPELVVIRPVLQGAIDKMALPLSAAELRAKVTATPIERTNLIKISVEDFERDHAIALANAVAESLVEHVGTLRLAQAQGPSPEVTGPSFDLSSFLAAEGRLSSVHDPILVSPAEVTSESTVSGASNTLRNTLLGVFLGALASVGAVVVLEHLRQPVRSQEELQRFSGLAPLGEIPRWRNHRKEPYSLVVNNSSDPAPGESFRRVATNLEFTALPREIQAIVIASPDSGDGRSTLVANLGTALSDNWREVVLMDTDLRCPSLHRFFGLDNNLGLTDLLANPSMPIVDVLKETPYRGLKVITAGPVPPNPLELLRCPRMTWLIEQLKEAADIVLLDTPPALALADGTALACQADGIVLVADAERNERANLKAALDSLQKPGAEVLGFIWNRSKRGPFHGRYRWRSYYRRLAPGLTVRPSLEMSKGSKVGTSGLSDRSTDLLFTNRLER